jgi:SH3-like domain-containing protein
MHAQVKYFILIMIVGFASVGFVVGAAAPPVKKPAVTASVPSFPYATEIIADNVPIRSGPGTNYYICGKLKKGDKVTVVGSRFSWSRIVPPSGSFSWISMRHVSIDPDDSSVGIVTSDDIRVYAGAEGKEPIHSEILQLKLNRSDEVRFVGKPKGDYYKIAPPTGAYLWVSTKDTKPVSKVEVKEIKPTVVPPPPKTDVNTATKTVIKPDIKTDANSIIPKTIAGEKENLKAYYALEKLIEAERAKPIDKQNYAKIKEALAVIAGNKDAGKAARYCDFALKRIKGFELALVVGKEIQLQNEELQKTKKVIDKARDTRLAMVTNLVRFAIIGKLQTSNIYGPEAKIKYYRIMDSTDKTVCYAVPTGPALKKDLSELVDSKVGLVGKIMPHPKTSGVLVQFTDIAELN